jgi:hypothetical protein
MMPHLIWALALLTVAAMTLFYFVNRQASLDNLKEKLRQLEERAENTTKWCDEMERSLLKTQELLKAPVVKVRSF